MLAALLVTGVLDEISTGPLVTSPEQTIIFPPIPGFSSPSPELPFGALSWPRAFDPADLEPRAADFSRILGAAKIASLLRISVSASAALFGLQIVDDPPRRPIVSEDGTTVQMWLSVDPTMQDNPAFTGMGVKVGISILIRSSASPYQEYERTGVLNVRQL